MSGTDTTSSTSRRPQEDGPEHVVKEAHWVGVLRPSLRGTVECRYHEREVQDSRPIKPGNHSPEVRSREHPGPNAQRSRRGRDRSEKCVFGISRYY